MARKISFKTGRGEKADSTQNAERRLGFPASEQSGDSAETPKTQRGSCWRQVRFICITGARSTEGWGFSLS